MRIKKEMNYNKREKNYKESKKERNVNHKHFMRL